MRIFHNIITRPKIRVREIRGRFMMWWFIFLFCFFASIYGLLFGQPTIEWKSIVTMALSAIPLYIEAFKDESN